MGAFVYSLPSDNLIDIATGITLATGTAIDTESNQDNINDRNPARALVLTGTSLDLVFQFSSPVLPKFAALIHTNLTVAARLQGHTSNSWGTPDVDQAFAIPTQKASGFFTSVFKDMSAQAAKAWWRLHIASNGNNIAIGEFWLGSEFRKLVSTTNYLLDGFQPSLQGQTQVHVTGYGVQLAYQRQPRQDAVDGSMIVDATDLATLETLIEAAQFRGRPFVVALDESVNDALMVRFAQDTFQKSKLSDLYYKIRLPLQQLSNGLPWVTPA